MNRTVLPGVYPEIIFGSPRVLDRRTSAESGGVEAGSNVAAASDGEFRTDNLHTQTRWTQ
jgi:hypothetical protein